MIMLGRHRWARSALALAAAAALCAALAQQGAARAAGAGARAADGAARAAASDGAGDFIIRCFFNTHIAPEDPIENPGSLHDDNLYDYFGNMAAGSAAGDGTTFPAIQSGDSGTSGTAATMEHNQLATPTNCQDTKDTAGYWEPAPYMVTSAGAATPWQNTNGCSANCQDKGPNENFLQRVYYIPHGSGNQEIADGTVMVTGFPSGCRTVVTGQPPPGCAGTAYPRDPAIILYGCGADSGHNLATPLSEWPYDCTHYTGNDGDDAYSDGEVAFVRFPYCWDGDTTGHFPAPNSPAVNGLPTATVPGYVAPWIGYDVWHTKYSMPARPVNDFAYPGSSGTCTTAPYTHTVIELEERMHLLTYGPGWGAPSSCTGDSRIGWNSLRNHENSDNQGDNPPNGDSDNDATMTVAPGVFGPWKCVAATAPGPDPGVATLSFACAHDGDPNCGIPLSSPVGCVTPGGTCYVGAYQPAAARYGWETLHAEYWQTWQEAEQALDNPTDVPADVGTFGDLVEDCMSGTAPSKCTPLFVVTSLKSPPQVYGTGGGAP
jgi:hypothetical protein